MNTKEQAIEQIEVFLKSDEKCMLLTGTHQYEKRKLIMRMLNQQLNNHLILFRTSSMQNISDREYLGWAGVKKIPKAGERLKIGKNTYECDSMFTENTWHKTSHTFSCAVVYPIDALCRERKAKPLQDLFQFKEIDKVFLVSWTDRSSYDYSLFSEYVSRQVIYDAEKEDPAYHKRVLDIIDELDGRRR